MGKTLLEKNAAIVHEARMKVMEDVLALQKKVITACMDHEYDSKYDIGIEITSSSLRVSIFTMPKHDSDKIENVYSEEIWGFDKLFQDFDRNYIPIGVFSKKAVKKTMDIVFYDKFKEMSAAVDKYIKLNKKSGNDNT